MFEIVQELGRGGMGVVYEAHHTLLKKRVALKLINESQLANTLAIERFLLEIEAIGKLNSPHIVAAFDAGEINGVYYLVMEYVDGPNLREVCEVKSRLALADACQVVHQTAIGLDHAHRSGLIHRDIKPSNLMLGRNGVVKVADLGLAKATTSDRPGGITDTGGIVGTLNYISPEQIEGRSLDARTDQYALGCAFYHLLTGKAPFSGAKYSSTYKKIQAHIHETPPPPSRCVEGIPDEIDRIVARLMSKQPSDRWPEMSSFNKTLEPFLNGSDLKALVSDIAKPVQESPPLHDATRSTSRIDAETVEFQQPPHGRWRVLTRWLIGGVVVGLVFVMMLIFAANWASIFPDTKPLERPRSVATVKDYTNAKFNKPIDLLREEPVPVFAEQSATFDKDFERLSDGLALHSFTDQRFSLGVIKRDSYVLEFELEQMRWVGGFDVFLGFGDGENSSEFHTLHFGFVGPPGKQEFSISRKHNHVLKSDDGSIFVRGKTISRAAITATDNSPHTISIRIVEGELESVRWNHQKLPALVAGVSDTEKNFQGQFGLSVHKSDVLIRAATLTILQTHPHDKTN